MVICLLYFLMKIECYNYHNLKCIRGIQASNQLFNYVELLSY